MRKFVAQAKRELRALQISFFVKLSKYIYQHFVELELLVLLFFVLHFLMFIPYLNLVVAPWMIYLVCIICSKYIFSLNRHDMVRIVMGLFIFAFIFTLRGNYQSAEEVGNVIYGVLWFVGIMSLKELSSS